MSKMFSWVDGLGNFVRSVPQGLVAVAMGALLSAGIASSAMADEPAQFSKSGIDIGMVCKDVEKSVAFYTKAIGLTERKGFEANGEFTKSIGLTAGHGISVRVLSAGDDPKGAILKLMQIPEGKPADAKNEFLHSQLGFRYLTLGVPDVTAAAARIKAAGYTTVANTPKEIPAALGSGVFIIVIRDPDGNFVELVGPKK